MTGEGGVLVVVALAFADSAWQRSGDRAAERGGNTLQATERGGGVSDGARMVAASEGVKSPRAAKESYK